MEIRAVVEALGVLPEGMHGWVLTDAVYVKNGITQWLPKWMNNSWKNSQGTPVANKSLWQKLYAEVSRQARAEGSWVKAHNGTLLNEFADILATAGVNNDPKPSPVQYVVAVGEDTDSMEYSLLDGEEKPLPSGRDDLLPEGDRFVTNEGDRCPLTQYLSGSGRASEVDEASVTQSESDDGYAWPRDALREQAGMSSSELTANVVIPAIDDLPIVRSDWWS
jgi:hypothetical protein